MHVITFIINFFCKIVILLKVKKYIYTINLMGKLKEAQSTGFEKSSIKRNFNMTSASFREIAGDSTSFKGSVCKMESFCKLLCLLIEFTPTNHL